MSNNLTKLIIKKNIKKILVKSNDSNNEIIKYFIACYIESFILKLKTATSIIIIESNEIVNSYKDQKKRILEIFESELNENAIIVELYSKIKELSTTIMNIGMSEVAQSIESSNNYNELDFLTIINSNIFWLKRQFEDRIYIKINEVLDETLGEKFTSEELQNKLLEIFTNVALFGKQAFADLAENSAYQTLELGRLMAYKNFGVEYVKIQARLDDRTTALCKSLHGKIIPVQRLVSQIDKYNKAVKEGDKKAAIKAWPFFNPTQSITEIPANLGSPPYHWKCRTITVPYKQ